jgi:hypothetical protein
MALANLDAANEFGVDTGCRKAAMLKQRLRR